MNYSYRFIVFLTIFNAGCQANVQGSVKINRTTESTEQQDISSGVGDHKTDSPQTLPVPKVSPQLPPYKDPKSDSESEGDQRDASIQLSFVGQASLSSDCELSQHGSVVFSNGRTFQSATIDANSLSASNKVVSAEGFSFKLFPAELSSGQSYEVTWRVDSVQGTFNYLSANYLGRRIDDGALNLALPPISAPGNIHMQASGIELPSTCMGGRTGSIAVGSENACVIHSDGRQVCWGQKGWGVLGDKSNILNPVNVRTLGSAEGLMVTKLATSISAACGITDSGAVKCWGQQRARQLGDNIDTTSFVMDPVQVIGFEGSSDATKAMSIASGFYRYLFCAVNKLNAVKCWGQGYASITEVFSFSEDISSIRMGRDHMCVLTGAGTVQCWGSNNRGQLGLGTGSNASYSTPQQVLTIDGTAGNRALDIQLGDGTSCALIDNGTVRCWGTDATGTVGDDAAASGNVYTPTQVSGIDGSLNNRAVKLGAMASVSICAILDSGATKCWGTGSQAQFGDPNFQSNIFLPVVPSSFDGSEGKRLTHYASGWVSACAIYEGGRVACMGQSNRLMLSDNGYYSKWAQVPTFLSRFDGSDGKKAKDISVNDYVTCILSTSGSVSCIWAYGFGDVVYNVNFQNKTPVAATKIARELPAVSQVAIGHR